MEAELDLLSQTRKKKELNNIIQFQIKESLRQNKVVKNENSGDVVNNSKRFSHLLQMRWFRSHP